MRVVMPLANMPLPPTASSGVHARPCGRWYRGWRVPQVSGKTLGCPRQAMSYDIELLPRGRVDEILRQYES
jgi:hypothetical protein